MPKSPAVRIAAGLAAGLCVTVAMFAMLFNLVDVQIRGDILKPVPIEFTRVIQDSEVREKRRLMVKVERETVPEVPRIPVGPAPDNRVEKPVVRVEHELVTRNGYPGTGGPEGIGIDFEAGTDQDVQPDFRLLPEYPRRQLALGVEGWVRVQFNITATGSVTDAVVVASEPEGTFDAAALTAISRWRYSPRVVDGEAVGRVGMQTTIEFELTE